VIFSTSFLCGVSVWNERNWLAGGEDLEISLIVLCYCWAFNCELSGRNYCPTTEMALIAR
jgi:hypothetical protein